MPRPRLPSWPTALTTLAVLVIHALVLWVLSDLIFNRPPTETITPGPYLIVGQAVALIALALLCLPLLKLLRRGRRPRDRHCPRCWYTIDPALGLKCSECGHEAPSERALHKPRRRWKLTAALLCLIALCQLSWLETRISQGGWLAAVPTEALIVSMPYVPDWCLQGGDADSAQDRSLQGRLIRRTAPARLRRWTDDRATGWALSTDRPRELIRRVELVSLPYAERPLFSGHHEPIAIHELAIGLAALQTGDVGSGEWLLDASRRTAGEGGHLFRDRPSRYTEALDANIPQLISALDARPRASIVWLLMLTDGRTDVVEALLRSVGESFPEASGALAVLAARNEPVRNRLCAVIADPADPRRILLIGPLGLAAASQKEPELSEAARAMLLTASRAEMKVLNPVVARYFPEHRDLAASRCTELGLANP